MNQIYQEDCLVTLNNPNITYDYVFCSPPDISELNYKSTEVERYTKFLSDRITLFNPRLNLVTFSLTDRKADSKIISKSFILKTIMFNLGYDLVSHKIWVKSLKEDMFRLTYSNVLTFGKGKIKNHKCKLFAPDVWEIKHKKYKNYSFGMPTEIPYRCISQYTSENDIVYDPFIGSGTTACASVKLNRNWIGTEIDKETTELAEIRINNTSFFFGND